VEERELIDDRLRQGWSFTDIATELGRSPSTVSHLEALEADTDAASEIRSWLRELAALKARRERELEAAERAVAAKPDRQELVDLLPLLDVDTALLAEESFGEVLGALDFQATYEPDRNELRVRAMLAPELVPASGHATSSLSSVPPGGVGPDLRRLVRLRQRLRLRVKRSP
jgi:transcriptional regulator with XRE-family HTH domain